MLAFASLLLAGHLLTPSLHPVDFQLMPSPQAQPFVPGTARPGANVYDSVETYAPPRYSIAHGFGNGVPLSFAVKQLVPSMFRVIYRAGVDPATEVSWSGGRSWNQALDTALRQHGLRLVLVGHTVTIGY